MKEKLSLLTVLAVLSISLPAEGQPWLGSGTEGDPYLIEDANDMQAIGADPNYWDAHFIMVNDINLAEYTGTQFNIIGNDSNAFTGVFDGDGHTISNFTYSSTGTDNIGLFGVVDGVNVCIKDLGLINPNIDAGTGDYVGSLSGVAYGTVSNCYVQGGSVTGDADVGGLVGSTGLAEYRPWPGGSVINCHANSSVSGNSSVGGLAGGNYGGIVSSSYSIGSVEGDYEIGGLVGSNRNYDYIVYSIIFNSYSTASITGTNDVGGLAGFNSWGSTVSNCYSTGSVTGTTETGGLVGECNDVNDVSDSFWDVNTSGQTSSDGGTPKTTAEMMNPNTFMDAGWDFVGQLDGPSDIWAEPVGGGYPILWWQVSPLPPLPSFSGGTGESNNPYLISTATELNSIGHNPRLMDAHFKLINDIDLTAVDFFIIGSIMYPFTGTFNGDGFEISNFSYTCTGLDNIGLFGAVDGVNACIKDLGLIDSNINAGTNAYATGSLIGLLTGGATLSNCYAEGGSISGDYDVGGLVGSAGLWAVSSPISLITNCYATVVVTGDLCVGGLLGTNYRGNILDCHATGEVTGGFAGGLVGFYSGSRDVVRSYATGDVSGHHGVGGLVGNISSGQISQCYATGSVTGTGLGAGGLVGSNFGTITDSYGTGTVTGNERVGGLAGSNYEVITNCYSIGSVSGNEEVGCLIGRVFGSPPPVTTASFWDSQTALPTTGSAGGTGKTTAEMQDSNTFLDAGWDFVGESDNGTEEIWTILEGKDYPRLAWEKQEGVKRRNISLIKNGSFENDGWINYITEENTPQYWDDVNIPSGKFDGWVNTNWQTYGDYSLTLYSGLVEFAAGDMATVSQQVYLMDVNEIIFDLRLGTIGGDPWDPDERSAVVLIDGNIVWDSNTSLGPNANGEYLNQTADVNQIYKDANPHTLSLAMKANKDKTEWYYEYLVRWDFIKFDAHCGGFGYLPEDLNRDCYIDILDLDILAKEWLAYNYDLLADDESIVNLRDFAVFASYWRDDTCQSSNGCEGSDFDGNRTVDSADLTIFAEHWLEPVVNLLSDLNTDRVINFEDVAIVAGGWLDNTDWENWQDDNCYKMELLAGDIDNSGEVYHGDILMLTDNWLGEGKDISVDINKDEVVDFLDFAIIADEWRLRSWLYGLE